MPGGRKSPREIPVPGQPHAPVAKFARFQHGYANTRAKLQAFAVTNTAARAYQPLNLGACAAKFVGPRTLKHQRQRRKQQKLYLAAGRTRAQQARLQHTRIVGHQQRPLGQAVWQIAELMVLKLKRALAGHDQQTRSPAFLWRKLGYLRFGQFKIITFEKKIRFLNGHNTWASLMNPSRCGLVSMRLRG